MIIPRIYADFNGVTSCPERISLTCLNLTGYGTLASLSRHQIRLREGMILIFYDPGDIEVEGRVFYDLTNPGKFTSPGRWLAAVDLDLVKDTEDNDESDLKQHPCFKCRLDLTEYLQIVGRQYKEFCPNCGTSIVYPLLPPDAD